MFQSLLQEKDIETLFILMYHNPIKSWADSLMVDKYINKLLDLPNTDCVPTEPVFEPSKDRETHAILMNTNMEYIIDPLVGIVYPYTIDDLEEYGAENIKSSLCYRDQYRFIKNSPHISRKYLLAYISPTFWKNIVLYKNEY
jgi:hypothetical protein